MGKIAHEDYIRFASVESNAKLYCCYTVIFLFGVVIVTLSAILSAQQPRDPRIVYEYVDCPKGWIGVNDKCYFFSEYATNWTYARTSCKVNKSEIARFDTEEELNFLSRYKGSFDYWIGLHRESSEHPWKWADNTTYNYSLSIRGAERYAYLNDIGISSARVYADKRWSCSKTKDYDPRRQLCST
ncbi:b1.5 [Murid betaherpesvirus 8]|uniref:B1.5 n=1 Tax=Rat cytomegalovirus (isolate England) TaxID=1261657 RepID=A0A0E3X3T4_RCMVE|nr:b1.5 [Murid betaherpesvirus 8]WPH24934.1 b1.5 [Murid betaherpesvirus 8]WPH25068.1 b1.5 [Murid betaherpesvirus 8]